MVNTFDGRIKFPESRSNKQCAANTPGSHGYWIRFEVSDLILSPVQWGYGVATIEICDPAQRIIVSSRVKVRFLAGQMGLPLKKISNVLTNGRVGGKHDFPKIDDGSKSLWNPWFSNGVPGVRLQGFDITKINLKRLSILQPKNGTNMKRHFILVARDNKNREIVYNNRDHLSRHWGWDIWNASLTFGRIGYKSHGAFAPITSRNGSCGTNRHGDIPRK